MIRTSIVTLLSHTMAALIADIKVRLAERDARLHGIEVRLRTLEEQPPKSVGIEWHGVYEDGRQYETGTLVTRSGSLWLATRRTSGVPGTEAAWKLCVKNGGYRP